ncbi:MAG: PAS domain-containing protein, partial [Acetobacteraceae bacterium]|nr:PAS domain-containing protein [Acetobacteraceae bacterium]
MRRIADGLAWLRGGTASATPALRALAELADPAARLLFDGDGQPRALLDRELHLVRANTALAGLLGEALGDALGELLAPDAPAAAEQAVGAVRAVATAIAHGAPPAGLPTAMLRTADGAPRPVQLALALVREADGSTSGAIVTFAPAAGTADTQARRYQAVGVLAGGVAHDFNNLLQAVIGAAESLSERPALSAAAREEVGLILQGARRGARLVRQLLAFAARQTLQPRVVAVNAVVADLAPLLRHSLGERVRLELALEEPGRFVRVDAGELDQVLLNLVMNARTAMPRGGTLHLRTGRLTLLAARAQQGAAGGSATIPPGRYVTIEVQDTGTGIPPDILPRIFEPFFTTRPDSGTGLGLASVAGIVRQSGGFIEVTTAAGQGSCFRILLPRSPEPATPKAAGPTA